MQNRLNRVGVYGNTPTSIKSISSALSVIECCNNGLLKVNELSPVEQVGAVMRNSQQQSSLDNIFPEKLTSGDIAACLPAGMERYSIYRSFIEDDFSEGTINGSFPFAGFTTSKGAVVFVKSHGECYIPLYTSYFWSDDYPADWWSTKECFQQCIAILETYPQAMHHNDALFDVLKNLAQPTSLLSK